MTDVDSCHNVIDVGSCHSPVTVYVAIIVTDDDPCVTHHLVRTITVASPLSWLSVPETDTGPGRLPRRKKQHTLFQRISAQDIEASDMDQVPALRMTRSGAKNVYHGLHLLLDSGKVTCPWPLSFFLANDRTAFPITMPRDQFPIDFRRGSTPAVAKEKKDREGEASTKLAPSRGTKGRKQQVQLPTDDGNKNLNRPALVSSEHSVGSWSDSSDDPQGDIGGLTIEKTASSTVFPRLADLQPEEVRAEQLAGGSTISTTRRKENENSTTRRKGDENSTAEWKGDERDRNRNMYTDPTSKELEAKEDSDEGSENSDRGEKIPTKSLKVPKADLRFSSPFPAKRRTPRPKVCNVT